MRLLKLGVYYPAYLEQLYARRPGLDAQTYSIQNAVLLGDCFGSSNFWTNALSKLGYETCDLVINAEPMQKTWAREHGFRFSETNWLFEIAAAQVKAFRPYVMIVADYSTVTAAFIKQLREECESLRLVIVWCGAPYNNGAIFDECDVVLSCVPELVTHFCDAGHLARHLNHAFEPRILEKLDTTFLPSADFVFIGSVVKSDQFHIEREQILTRLIEETDLQIWSSISPPRFSILDAGRRVIGVIKGRKQWETNGVDKRVKAHAQPPIFGLEMFQRLHDSRVALNTHIDISSTSASNMRLFEATGVGTCLLTDWKANLDHLFEPDNEVVAYRNVDECVEKVNYLLNHETERQAIATAGQHRTLRDHNFDVRAAQIDTIIREVSAQARTSYVA